MIFKRDIVESIIQSVSQTGDVFHAIIGPRQVGKTTSAHQIATALGWPSVMASADGPIAPGPEWIAQQWVQGELLAANSKTPVLVVLDEIQKVNRWSDALKQVWDARWASRDHIRLIVLGSSALLIGKGLTESLAGRFLLHRAVHWDWVECELAFGWSLTEWIYFGGYPGGSRFKDNQTQWKAYIRDSLIEAVVSKDVLALHPITKPALMRNLFYLSTLYPAHVFSYSKMLGQLIEAGNTTTLAHYLTILDQSFLVTGLEQFSLGIQRKRGSSPKLILRNNALINAVSAYTLAETVQNGVWWGHVVENAVGAHLLNHLNSPEWQVSYWRHRNLEVDFVVQHGDAVWAIEVKSGRRSTQTGLHAFQTRYPQSKLIILGGNGVPLEVFFKNPPAGFLLAFRD